MRLVNYEAMDLNIIDLSPNSGPWIHPEGPRGGDWLLTLDLPNFHEMEFYEMMIE